MIFPAPDNQYSTLTQIRTKVRRLTKSPSTAKLTDAELDNYINTFVLYDIPTTLRLFSLRTVLRFYTKPYIGTYATNTTDANDPLFNFTSKYMTVGNPIYVDGYQIMMSQSTEQFFGLYPMPNSAIVIGIGDGVAAINITGTLAHPIVQNNITFGSIDVFNGAITIKDTPSDPWVGTGTLSCVETGLPAGTINYITGVYTVFSTAICLNGANIYARTVPYVAGRPQGMLYFQDTFTFRPIPDTVYPVLLEAYMRPSELLLANDSPELAQWWQYIAYGASKKVFEDRQDTDSVDTIMPEFKEQETMVLRRTLEQGFGDRAATIFTESNIRNLNNNGFNQW